jgi:hypothetical protein
VRKSPCRGATPYGSCSRGSRPNADDTSASRGDKGNPEAALAATSIQWITPSLLMGSCRLWHALAWPPAGYRRLPHATSPSCWSLRCRMAQPLPYVGERHRHKRG